MVRFCKLQKSAVTPKRKNSTDAGIDIYSNEDKTIPPLSEAKIHTGISIEIPVGFMGLLKPKGKSNWLVGAGVVDAQYEPGEYIVRIFNPTMFTLNIKHGTPVCQLVIIPISTPELKEVSKKDLENSSERSGKGGIHNA